MQGTGFKYWGGFNDIAGHMKTYNGSHQVLTASVGPVSSNWDRAVELYYQIKGGCVDYGATRTAQFAACGKIQKPAGKCWAADPLNNPNHYPVALYPQWDAAHPIHLVARELNNWVKTSPNVYYYSIGNKATEAGSFCCNGTDRVIAPIQSASYQYARDDMLFFLKNTAGEWVVPSIGKEGMGSYTQSNPARVIVDSSWFPNDGVVNTNSMKNPAGQPVRNYDGTSVRGTWNYLGYYNQFDHLDVVDWQLPITSVYPIYDNLSNILFGL